MVGEGTYNGGQIDHNRNLEFFQFITRTNATEFQDLGRVESTACNNNLTLSTNLTKLAALLRIVACVTSVQRLAMEILNTISLRLLPLNSVAEENTGSKTIRAESKRVHLCTVLIASVYSIDEKLTTSRAAEVLVNVERKLIGSLVLVACWVSYVHVTFQKLDQLVLAFDFNAFELTDSFTDDGGYTRTVYHVGDVVTADLWS